VNPDIEEIHTGGSGDLSTRVRVRVGVLILKGEGGFRCRIRARTLYCKLIVTFPDNGDVVHIIGVLPESQ